jgi:hypothetical protein
MAASIATFTSEPKARAQSHCVERPDTEVDRRTRAGNHDQDAARVNGEGPPPPPHRGGGHPRTYCRRSMAIADHDG